MPRVSDPRLIRVEEALRHEPGSHESIEHWASLANMSVRTFTRRIKDETNLSFSDWRQQIRLTEAVVGTGRRRACHHNCALVGLRKYGIFQPNVQARNGN